jgi:hypothetical protein
MNRSLSVGFAKKMDTMIDPNDGPYLPGFQWNLEDGKLPNGHFALTLSDCDLGYVERQDCRETWPHALWNGHTTPLKFEKCRQRVIVPQNTDVYFHGGTMIAADWRLGPLVPESTTFSFFQWWTGCALCKQKNPIMWKSNEIPMKQFTFAPAANVICKKGQLLPSDPMKNYFFGGKPADFLSPPKGPLKILSGLRMIL